MVSSFTERAINLFMSPRAERLSGSAARVAFSGDGMPISDISVVAPHTKEESAILRVERVFGEGSLDDPVITDTISFSLLSTAEAVARELRLPRARERIDQVQEVSRKLNLFAGITAAIDRIRSWNVQ